MKYFDEMCRAMEWLARDPRVMFLGQAVGCPGTAMTNTLKNVARDKLLELPVAEEMQMGMATDWRSPAGCPSVSSHVELPVCWPSTRWSTILKFPPCPTAATGPR